MKRSVLCIALALAFLLVTVSVGLAQMEASGIPVTTICLDSLTSCNDCYLSLERSAPGGVFALHGYEYGCGYQDRLADGSLLFAGGYAYIGLVLSLGSSSGCGDCGSIGARNYVIDLSNMQGEYLYNYVYMNGGVIDGHCGNGEAVMRIGCPPPGTAVTDEPDETIR